MKALSHEEVLRVLKAAADNPRDLAMVLLAFRHGMRASEVTGLELKDLDLKNNEIVIRRLKGSLKTTQPLADVPGQPLLSERRVLRDWLKERGEHPSRYVFVSQKSGKLNRSTFYRVFSDAAERAGLPADKRHPHVLKHSLGVALRFFDTQEVLTISILHQQFATLVKYRALQTMMVGGKKLGGYGVPCVQVFSRF